VVDYLWNPTEPDKNWASQPFIRSNGFHKWSSSHNYKITCSNSLKFEQIIWEDPDKKNCERIKYKVLKIWFYWVLLQQYNLMLYRRTAMSCTAAISYTTRSDTMICGIMFVHPIQSRHIGWDPRICVLHIGSAWILPNVSKLYENCAKMLYLKNHFLT